VSILTDTLPDGRKKVGLSSGFFKRVQKALLEGKKAPRVRVQVKESTFHLPTSP